MNIWDETKRSLVELNKELSNNRDPARIRYFVIQPDPDWDADWVTAVWELPPPERGCEVWPVSTLMRYEQMLEDRLGRTLTTSCLFRTKETVAEAYEKAQRVPDPDEAADTVSESR